MKTASVFDGSGWVKVEDEAGNSGLVPASYLALAPMRDESAGGAKERQRAGKSVRALYPYVAQGPDELDLQPGDVLELLAEQKYDGGWWEGFNAQGKKGIFPSNYVKSV